MGARPAMRITVRETEDAEGDGALLRSLADVVRAHPGSDLVVLTVVALDGERYRFAWRARVTRSLRRAAAALLLGRCPRLQS